jgi:hypothetical protein
MMFLGAFLLSMSLQRFGFDLPTPMPPIYSPLR